MMDETAMGVPLDSIAHIIQVALTPVSLLSGIGSLLNVITARLGRVADQPDVLLEILRSGGGGDAATAARAGRRTCLRGAGGGRHLRCHRCRTLHEHP